MKGIKENFSESSSPWTKLKSHFLKHDIIREGNDTPLQYSCLENLIDGGAW